jgi:hypothetical protein
MSEEEIKQEIEQVGYKEFYRYYKEKDILLNKQKEVLDKIKEYIKENANANVDYILELLEEIE